LFRPIETKLPLSYNESDGFFESITDISISIKQNLKCLFFTAKGERVRDTDFGIGIYQYLFEIDKAQIVKEALSDEIYRQISKYMPYISIDDVAIQYDGDKLYVKLLYVVPRINIRDSISLEV